MSLRSLRENRMRLSHRRFNCCFMLSFLSRLNHRSIVVYPMHPMDKRPKDGGRGISGSLLFSPSPIEMGCRSYSWGNRSSRLLGSAGRSWLMERTYRIVLLTDMQKTLPPPPLPTALPSISTNLTAPQRPLTLINPLSRKSRIRKPQITNNPLVHNRHNRATIPLP